MTDKIAIIGSQPLGSPTEINGILHSKTNIVISVSEKPEPLTKSFLIEKIVDFPDTRLLPETRKERRKKARKDKKRR